MAELSPHPPWRSLRGAATIAFVRLRFVLLVSMVLAAFVVWPTLRNTLDKLTTSAPTGGTVSQEIEYWCPMCPGVLSEWPAKCPVCSMALVRRQKGDMTPLPDGVVARVQLSPYRIQLAGLRTAPVEYRPLMCDVRMGGLLESPGGTAGSSVSLMLTADLFEPEASMVRIGQSGTVTCEGSSGETVPGHIVDLAPAASPSAGKRIRIRVENPHGELQPNRYVTVQFQLPLASVESSRRAEAALWRDRVAVDLLVGPYAAFASLNEVAGRNAASRKGLSLSIPESAVVETGTRRVVYTETMPGVFDAVEVRLGRRCGDYYPVREGLEPGQRVVTTGSILLDAETRLNPNVAASYFGAGSRPASISPVPTALSLPSSEGDDVLIAKQKICPVTGEPLGSMGAPVRVAVSGRTVFVCCKGCEKPLLRKPDEYLAKIPK